MGDLNALEGQPVGRITVERGGDGQVLRLAGEIDADTVDSYRQPPPGDPVISVVDLTGVEFLSSSGVAFVIRQTQPSRDRGHLPCVRGLSPRARRILEITGAITMFQPAVPAGDAGAQRST